MMPRFILVFLISIATGSGFGASLCSITTTGCSEGEATCTAAGTEPTTLYTSGGGSSTSWQTGVCVKESAFLRCTQVSHSVLSTAPDKISEGYASSSFACCDHSGKAFATAVEADAKKNCEHP